MTNIVIPDITGFTPIHAYAMFRCAMPYNTFAGANSMGNYYMQFDKAAAGWTNCLHFPTGTLYTGAVGALGGFEVMGDIDILARVV